MIGWLAVTKLKNFCGSRHRYKKQLGLLHKFARGCPSLLLHCRLFHEPIIFYGTTIFDHSWLYAPTSNNNFEHALKVIDVQSFVVSVSFIVVKLIAITDSLLYKNQNECAFESNYFLFTWCWKLDLYGLKMVCPKTCLLFTPWASSLSWLYLW